MLNLDLEKLILSFVEALVKSTYIGTFTFVSRLGDYL